MPGCKESQVLTSCLSTYYLIAFSGGSDPNPPFRVHSPAMPGGVLKSLHIAASTLPGGLGSVGMNCALNLSSLPSGILSVHKGSLLNHASLPFFRRSLCGTHTAGPRHCQAVMHFTSQNGKKSLVRTGCSLLLPSTVLGDRISLLDFPSWCCSHGCPAHCLLTA